MNFKQFAVSAVIGIMVSASAANATTYVLTITSKTLTHCSGDPGIRGVKKLITTFYSSAPFPSSFQGYYNAPYNFSDGVNTLTSLTNEGYTPTYGEYPILDYTENPRTGKISGWSYEIFMSTETDDFYQAGGDNQSGATGTVTIYEGNAAGTTGAACGTTAKAAASAVFSTQP